MDPLTSKAFLNIAFDLMSTWIICDFQAEIEYNSSNKDRLAYRIELEMRRMGYPAEDATYFAQAITTEEDSEVTKNLGEKVLYEMAMEWLTRSYHFLSTEDVKEIRDCIDDLEQPSREQKNEFLKNLIHQIATRFIDESEEPPLS